MNLVKESISFQRGVDPKSVLGIGDSYIIKNCIKNIYKEDFKHAYVITVNGVREPGNIIYVKVNENKFTIQFFSNEYQDEHTKKTISKQRYAEKLVSLAEISRFFDNFSYIDRYSQDSYQAQFLIKDEYVYLFSQLEGIHHFKTYEYLQESLSFQRGLDPKKVLGIGNDFNTLSIGAILKPKYDGIALTTNRSGNFIRKSDAKFRGFDLDTDSYLLVADIRPSRRREKYTLIRFTRARNNETRTAWEAVKEWKDILIAHGDFYPLSSNNMVVSKKMFDNRFEIIERGI